MTTMLMSMVPMNTLRLMPNRARLRLNSGAASVVSISLSWGISCFPHPSPKWRHKSYGLYH